MERRKFCSPDFGVEVVVCHFGSRTEVAVHCGGRTVINTTYHQGGPVQRASFRRKKQRGFVEVRGTGHCRDLFWLELEVERTQQHPPPKESKPRERRRCLAALELWGDRKRENHAGFHEVKRPKQAKAQEAEVAKKETPPSEKRNC